jgi:Dockerin type I domain
VNVQDGARWDILDLTVGRSGGIGEMHVTGGAWVTSEIGRIGESSGHGTVEVRDGGNWLTGGLLIRSGNLRIASQGRVVVDPKLFRVEVGQNSSIEVDGGTLQIGNTPGAPDEIIVGNGGIFLYGGRVASSRTRVTSSGSISGNGTIDGDVANEGLVAPGPAYAAAPPGSSFGNVPSGTKAQLWVQGKYTQVAEAGLTLLVDEQNGTGEPTSKVPLVVSGAAALRGTLKVEYTGATPSAGEHFNLIKYGSIASRFDTFEGAKIPGTDAVFFGLNYREEGLELMALETPRLVGGGHLSAANQQNNQLVLIAHGTISDADGWVAAMASEVASKSVGWDVVTFDWRADANSLPVSTAEVAIDIGESLGRWLKETGITYRGALHVLSHSSGAWLADSLADQMRMDDATLPIHVTLWDAFSGLGLLDKPGAPKPTLDDLGDSATFADQIVDMRNPLGLNSGTANVLSRFLNVDVTQVGPDSFNPLVTHAWPYQWYFQTVVDPSVGGEYGVSALLGYPNSLEWRQQAGLNSLPAHEGLFERGTHLIVTPSGIASWDGTLINTQPVDLEENYIGSDTGTIVFDPDNSVVLSTGSPVILTSFLTLQEQANVFSFNFAFLTGGDGLLSAYFDGKQFFGVSSVDLAARDQLFETGHIWLDELALPGTHTLILRVDPLGSQQAFARLTDFQFAYAPLTIVTLGGMPDLNLDGLVNIFDLNLVSSNWGGHGPAGDANKDGTVDIFDINLISAHWSVPGDVNGDGSVNIFDINLVSSNWGGPGPGGDANKDGAVNIFDINLISANWTPTGAVGVPEPATWSLALLSALVMFPTVRRAHQKKQ